MPSKAKRKKTKAKIPKNRISVPMVPAESPDTGIHVIDQVKGVRYKVWYHHGDRKRYVTLPYGISIAEARERRDTLYRNLVNQYEAVRRRKRTDGDSKAPAPRPITLDEVGATDRYIYKRDPYVVRIRGRQIGTSATKTGAMLLRNEFLGQNTKDHP